MPQQEPVIIVVEDDASMSQALERILRLGGHVCASYNSAEDYLADEERSRAACLIIDIQLPGLTGFELWDELSRAGRTAPVIFITAFDDPDARTKARVAGAAAFLAKPFSGRTLLETLQVALRT